MSPAGDSWSDTFFRGDRSSARSAFLTGLYRVVVAAFLVALGTGTIDWLGTAVVAWVGELAALGYLIFAIAWLIRFRRPAQVDPRTLRYFVYLGTSVDVLAIALLMLAFGGVASGLGLLLLPPIVATALISDGRMSLFFAAIATLGILAGELVSQYANESGLTQAALLGIALFISAAVAWRLASRIDATEAEIHRADRTLRNYAELNAQIIAQLQLGVVAIDADGHILSINREARNLLPPRVGRRLEDIDPHLFTLVQMHRGPDALHEIVLPPGRDRRELIMRISRIGSDGSVTLILLEDAAARRRQVQAQKLTALGRLTASIAHEIRNPLAGISHSAQLLAESPGLSTADRRLLEILQSHGQRVNTIIENILSLSRQTPAVREQFVLQDFLERFVEEFQASRSRDTRPVRAVVDPPESCTDFVPSQLQQVLWNLCGNAFRHAGADARVDIIGGRGQITPSVTLDVIDNGPGIPDEQRERLFEPFSAGTHGGTGLGLYISRMLCENNDATLEFVPHPGGSCFRITFSEPIASGPGAAKSNGASHR